MDYNKISLKCGIEIHQELDTQHKLFCNCPPKLSDRKPEIIFTRYLRPSQSELGEIDPAALFEFMKGKQIQYEADSETNCLVEMDEEPPHNLNIEALDITLNFSLMVNSKPIDEIWIMRKTVVDGSNTGGFQRTSVIAFGGFVEVSGKKYNINQICLEEDAARNIHEDEKQVNYRLDRLGIPLMEITTAPEMFTPEEVQVVAQHIGSILRATGQVRRGLGTIRQDLNISTFGGPVVEIKGVQALELIPTIVDYEAKRQATLVEIKNILEQKKFSSINIDGVQHNVTKIFEQTESKIIKSALNNNGVVYAVKLPGFAGIIGKEVCPGRRLGTEISDYAKFYGGVKGLFHTDELPGYNITVDEVSKLKAHVNASELDAVVIVADRLEKTQKALDTVILRSKEVFNGVLLETRSANPDGTTRFTRPRPGAARMYPETDVKPIIILPEKISQLKQNLPDMPEVKLLKYQEKYQLNEKLARQIVDSDYINLFGELVSTYPSLSTLLSVTLTEDLKKLQRDGIPIEELSDENIKDVFKFISEGKLVKESIIPILTWLSHNPENNVDNALKKLNLALIDEIELDKIIDLKIESNLELIKKMGEKALGPLMGMVMNDLRGKVKASDVQTKILLKIKKYLKF
ncbi:Glu-tRNA(Gln) amidotransferase subunit GatE [Candidatus Bathyarchaeota archaeon]|nr:Glu-tRNA(Gln) amidotransferase subunit GatE [Candidatus Bathyarchaeota archaeon]